MDPYKGDIGPLLKQLEEMAAGGEPDAQVRLQLAYLLGNWPVRGGAGKELGELVLKHRDDPHLTAAALSSLHELSALGMASTLLHDPAPPAAIVRQILAMLASDNNPRELSILVEQIATPKDGRYAAWQMEALAGAFDGLAAAGREPEKFIFEDVWAKAWLDDHAGAADGGRREVGRGRACRGTCRPGRERRRRRGRHLARRTPRPAEQRGAAIRRTGRARRGCRARGGGMLLAGWKGYTPALRSQGSTWS